MTVALSSFFLGFIFFFFNDTATTEIYTLSLHDALPISSNRRLTSLSRSSSRAGLYCAICRSEEHTSESSHTVISYAVFCLKKKKHINKNIRKKKKKKKKTNKQKHTNTK